MSRIGKVPVHIPSGVVVTISENITVKGPKGVLVLSIVPSLEYVYEEDSVVIKQRENSRVAREQHGLQRTLLANAVEGVTRGFEKSLEVLGVGYRVAVKGDSIELAVGFSHPVIVSIPEELSAKADGNKLTIMGISKEAVGQFAAKVRDIKRPEPYKGKGIRYEGEYVRRKAGKSAGKG